MAYTVAATIPAAALAFYLAIGNPKALTSRGSSNTLPPSGSQSDEMTPQRIEANVAALAKRLELNPGDAQGWVMLGRSYSALQRYSEAASAYARATALIKTDADLWADYGEALAMARGRNLAGEPLEAVNRALQLDPKNQKALALAGSAAFEAHDYQRALDYWQKLLAVLPEGSNLHKAVADQIAKAKELAAGR